MLKRARRKYLSQPLAIALANHARSQGIDAVIAGDRDREGERARMERSYRHSYYCANTLTQTGGALQSRYCSNRWCQACAAQKTGRLVNRYVGVLDTWNDPYFVTLTRPNVRSADLVGRVPPWLNWDAGRQGPQVENAGKRVGSELDAMLATFTRVKERMRALGCRLVAIRKTEVTYNGQRRDYHPHFHVYVRGWAAAQLLRDLWIDENGWLDWKAGEQGPQLRHAANPAANDVRPAEKGELLELFKYFTKLVTRTKSTRSDGYRSSVGMTSAANLDPIFTAMRGRRVFQSVGFRLPKDDATVDAITEAPAHTRGRDGEFPAADVWKWSQRAHDWISSDGVALTEFTPSVVMRMIAVRAWNEPDTRVVLDETTAVVAHAPTYPVCRGPAFDGWLKWKAGQQGPLPARELRVQRAEQMDLAREAEASLSHHEDSLTHAVHRNHGSSDRWPRATAHHAHDRVSARPIEGATDFE